MDHDAVIQYSEVNAAIGDSLDLPDRVGSESFIKFEDKFVIFAFLMGNYDQYPILITSIDDFVPIEFFTLELVVFSS